MTDLTPRELDVLRCWDRGLTDQEIARDLRVRVPTVKWLGRSIRHKLGTVDRASSVGHGHRVGLLA